MVDRPRAVRAKLKQRMGLWIAPAKNEENVRAVRVDRMWLVRE